MKFWIPWWISAVVTAVALADVLVAVWRWPVVRDVFLSDWKTVVLNGVILLAYLIAIPANEIVIPTILMLTVMVTGITGVGEQVTVKACRNADCSQLYTGSVTVTLQPGDAGVPDGPRQACRNP